jgi:uncharacterized protein DUF5683
LKQLFFIFIIPFFLSLPKAKAQTDSTRLPVDTAANRALAIEDSTALAKKNKKKVYSTARRAAILSAVIPGAGQAYNKKYWKIPIIYAGLGAFGYLFVTNNKEYNFYRKNLVAFYDTDSNTTNTTRYSGEQLQSLKAEYKKKRNLGVIGMVAIYLVNIVDANVDGHLKTFDVSDDLSLSVDPWQTINYGNNGYRSAMGVSLKLNFK